MCTVLRALSAVLCSIGVLPVLGERKGRQPEISPLHSPGRERESCWHGGVKPDWQVSASCPGQLFRTCTVTNEILFLTIGQ